MTVRELLERLEKVEPEAEVLLEPMRFVPVLNEAPDRLPSVEIQFPIEEVMVFTDLRANAGKKSLVLGYDDQALQDVASVS